MPEGVVSIDLADGAATVRVDAAVHPLEAVYAAAYTFIDRCFVFIQRPSPDHFTVTLSVKRIDEAEPEGLRRLAGELANELLACTWRQQLTRNNRAVIESVTMQAFAGAMGPPSLEDLEDFDFTDEPFDDPLGIATSWEDKYKKKGKKGEEGETA
jgi:His-Xaa-Ser system protein HxsD